MPITASHGKPIRPEGDPMNARTADAANRTWRTTLQGAAVVAILAVATALLDWLEAGDFSWRTLGIAALTAALTAVLAYLHRTVLDPSGLPSALPPTNPGPPATTDPTP